MVTWSKNYELLKLMSINVQEIKQGYLAQKHALLVAKNLKLLIKGSPNTKLATYSTGRPLALVSLGRKEGVAQLPFLTISGCLPGKIKSRDLFIGKTRKQMGLNGWLHPWKHGNETSCALVFRQGNGISSNKECAVLICPVFVQMWCGCLNGGEQSVLCTWLIGNEQSVCYVHVFLWKKVMCMYTRTLLVQYNVMFKLQTMSTFVCWQKASMDSLCLSSMQCQQWQFDAYGACGWRLEKIHVPVRGSAH